MDASTTARLAGELEPRVVGGRIRDVVPVGPSAMALDIEHPDGHRDHLVVAVDRALPLVCVADEPPGAGPGSVDHHLVRELVGGAVRALRALPDEPVIELDVERTNPAGISTLRTATVALGNRPGITVGPSRRERRDASDAERDGAIIVTEWTDGAGRTRARLSSEGTSRGDPNRRSTSFDSANAAALHAFEAVFAGLGPSRRRNALRKTITTNLRRKRRAITKVESEIADAARADEYRAKGQLILARKRDIRAGSPVARLLDYDGSTHVQVELNPELSPQENAETYFRKARKAEKRGRRAPERLGSLEEEIARLERALDSIASASDQELDRLEERFSPTLKARGRRARDGGRAHYRTYRVSGGWEVLVGKSNRDNDVLTHKVARPGDLWFHARQAAGSHVVLRIPDGDRRPDKQAILETAAIAAYHSKAGRSSKVSVSYTEKRHVRKPRGSKPGLAVISRERSVMVRPAVPETDAS